MHRPIAQGIVGALVEIFHNQRPADKVVEFAFKHNRRWGSRDRRQFAESVYDLVRWWRKYLWLAGVEWPATDVPPVLSEEDTWRVLTVYASERKFQIADREEKKIRPGIEAQTRATRQSLPDWLDRWAEAEVTDWDEIAGRLNETAPVYLRANRLKTNSSSLKALLEKSHLRIQLVGADALVLMERSNVFAVPEFKQGLFEVQDQHSQYVAPFLKPEPGLRVIDACAGTGGKTLHLAALMQNKGKILAMDIAEPKLTELKRRARRAGAASIETRWIESSKTIKRLEASADRVLLDVPCSGIGVLRRNPDAKWRLSPEKIDRLKTLQLEILNRYSKMLKPGGLLVYSTCSIAKCENQDQVKAFMGAHPGQFELEEEKLFQPQVQGGDGFYAARLKRLS